MSLGIAFKGPEGIVLAADSRVTLNMEVPQGTEKLIIPATFDNATKLLRFQNHNYVGAVTYGAGAIGTKEPRTAHSFLPGERKGSSPFSRRRSSAGETDDKETTMVWETSQATSRDWLAGREDIRFSTKNFIESATLSLSESRLYIISDLSLEFWLWDLLSDEALRKFEGSL